MQLVNAIAPCNTFTKAWDFDSFLFLCGAGALARVGVDGQGPYGSIPALNSSAWASATRGYGVALRRRKSPGNFDRVSHNPAATAAPHVIARSEERRVGKECRSRW